MSVRDGVGNELQKGDLVLVQLPHPFVVGQVVALKEGGVDLASAKPQKSPGMIQILCPENIAFQPGPHARIPVVFKLTNPDAQAILDKVAEQANAGIPSNVAEFPTPATAKPPVEI